MIVTGQAQTRRIFDVIVDAARLDIPGMGIAYIIPIHAAAGFFPESVAAK